MTSDGVPRIPAPLPANDASLISGPQLALRAYRHFLKKRDYFFSILLGAPDYSSDMDDTLWLPQYVKTITPTSHNLEQLFKLVMGTLFREVTCLGTKATGVAKRFAELKLDKVEPLLFKLLRPALHQIALRDLRSALQQIVVDVPFGEIGEPARVLEGASRILEHGAEPSTPFWFHDVALKERVGDTLDVSKQLLGRPFNEVIKFRARATDVAMAFAKMDIVDVQRLLEERNTAELRSTLARFDTATEDRDTQELINMFISPFEAGPSTADALPQNSGFDFMPFDYDF